MLCCSAHTGRLPTTRRCLIPGRAEYSGGLPVKINASRLHDLAASIFHAAGCSAGEAGRVAGHLVEADLVGHDSHGVIRIGPYLRWLTAGRVLADRTIQVAFENEAVAVVDGRFGFGQTVGE